MLAALIAAASIFFFMCGFSVLGVPALLLTLGLATTYQYIVLDFKAGYIGEFSAVFGLFPAGGWEKLPAHQHVVLKRYGERHTGSIGKYGGSKTTSQRFYLIMLSIPAESHGFIVMEVQNLQKARKIANDISVASGLELKDFTLSQS